MREQNDKAGFHILRFKGVQTVLIFRQLSKTGYVAFELVPLQAISPVMDALFHKAILFCLWACILCVLLNLLLSRLITKPVAVMSLRLSEMELQAQSYNDNLRRSYYRALAAGQMDPYKLPLPSILDQPMKNLFGSDADVTGVLWMDGQLTDTQFQQFIITFRDQFSDVFRVSQNKFLAVFSANHPDRTGAFYRLVRMVSRSGYVTDFSEVKNLNELPRCSQYLQSLLNEARFFTMSLGKVVPTVKSNQTPALSSLEKQLISALWEWNGQKALQYFNEMIALGQHEEYSRFRQFLVHLSFEITFALSAMSGTSLRQKHLLSLLESAQVIETVSNAKTAVEILELFEPFFSEISKKDVNPSHQHTITQITKRIEQDYANPQLSMVLLAEGTGLSASYLGKLFIAYKGLPISEFISQLRILEACRLLSETQESIEAIAMASGFENTKYFYSVFKKQIHCTPKEYRKHHRDGIQH
ncbi:HTH-type transcriptional activator RhaR [bioreactor metagenome]|uniref:HTH-type transcriptional activator RhaR n=1 Tax=bioreactor metagenome TaxID=1076179 RepID=A0A645C2P7_9ZZZZ